MIDGLNASNNVQAGIWWEACKGPAWLIESTIDENSNFGVLIGDSGGIEIRRCRIAGNYPSRVAVGMRTTTDGQAGRFCKDRNNKSIFIGVPKNIALEDNEIAATQPQELILQFVWGNPMGRAIFFEEVNDIGNGFWHPSRRDAFAGPVPRIFPFISLDERNRLVNKATSRCSLSVWNEPSETKAVISEPK